MQREITTAGIRELGITNNFTIRTTCPTQVLVIDRAAAAIIEVGSVVGKDIVLHNSIGHASTDGKCRTAIAVKRVVVHLCVVRVTVAYPCQPTIVIVVDNVIVELYIGP